MIFEIASAGSVSSREIRLSVALDRRFGTIGVSAVLASLWLALGFLAAPARGELAFDRSQLDLPGEPADVAAVDLDGDGLVDLAVVSLSTQWDEIGIDEPVDPSLLEGLDPAQVEALASGGGVESLTIVPALFVRRDLSVFLATAPGRWPSEAAATLELGDTVHGVLAGPPAAPLLVLDETGLAAVYLDRDPEDEWRLDLEPVAVAASVLARTTSYVEGLDLSHDLDGDGRLEVLFPGADALTVYRQRSAQTVRSSLGDDFVGPRPSPLERAQRIPLPADRHGQDRRVPDPNPSPEAASPAGLDGVRRLYPLPLVRDLDGDGALDLLFLDPRRFWESVYLARGVPAETGERVARFVSEPIGPLERACCRPQTLEPAASGTGSNETGANGASGACPPIVFFGDLDGDSSLEYLAEESLVDLDLGLRRGLQQTKRPPFRYHWLPAEPDLSPADEPLRTFRSEGYAFDRDGDKFFVPAGLRDLDGDGDLDLVTLTLDVSAVQLLRVVALRSLSVGFDFHVYCQDEGVFDAVAGLDLSGRFKVRLADIRIRQISQLRGDYDGDGRIDFLQAGRGREVTIHRGRAGCRYPAEPDATLRLEAEPEDLDRVRLRDLDGDGRTDLLIVEDGTSAQRDRPRDASRDGDTRNHGRNGHTRLLVFRSLGLDT